MLDTVGMIHGQRLPVDILDIDFERVCFVLVTALVQKIFEFLCIGVVKDPLVAHVELKCLICLSDLLNAIFQLSDITTELLGAEDSSNIEKCLGRQLRPESESFLVGFDIAVEGQLRCSCSLLVGEVVLVSDHIAEKLHSCNGILPRSRTLNNEESLPSLCVDCLPLGVGGGDEQLVSDVIDGDGVKGRVRIARHVFHHTKTNCKGHTTQEPLRVCPARHRFTFSSRDD